MNALELDESGRARLRELIPWLVNGTLGEADAARLRALIASDLTTRREWREAQALAEAVAAQDTLDPDLESQLQRVRARIAPQPARATRDQRMHRRWRVAALLLLPLVGLSAFAVHWLTVPRYATLSDVSPAASESMLRLRMQLVAEVPVADVDAVLRPFGARVTEGPAAPGLYTIELPPRQRRAVEQALDERFEPAWLAPAAY